MLAAFFPARAQFAVVADNDGFANIREGAGTQSAVKGRVGNGEIVYCMETTGDWYNVDYYTNNDIATGYIHKRRCAGHPV